MAAVEKILLQFDADIKALKADMNQAKKQMGDVEEKGKKTSSSLTKSFKSVGAAIGAAFSVQVLIQFTKKAVELYDIQAKAEASLLQALKGREAVQKRLISQAQELQKVTLFGDEETIRAQAMLAKFGMTEAVIKRLIPLIQDYAAAQGQDLVSSADMVARSIGTSTNALTRYGIEIEGAVGSSERLESAVESLNDMFGGQAVAAAEAGAGAVTQFNMAWGDFAEAVGEEILPALTGLINTGNKLVNILKVGRIGGIFALPKGEVDEAKRYNDEQAKFIAYQIKNKETFKNLAEAGEAYQSFLDEQIATFSTYTDENGKLTRGAQTQINVLTTAKEAVSDYIKEVGSGVKLTDELKKGTDDLNKKVLDLSESLDVLPKILSDIYDPLSELPDETERWRVALSRLLGDVENNDGIADFYDNLEKSIKSADDANIDFFKSIEDNNGVIDNSILYARQLSDAMGMLQGSISDIAGEQGKFTNFLQSLSIAQILFSRSVAIANAVEAGSLSLKQPGGLLKFLATTTFIISQITGFIGDSLKTVRSQQVPAYADGVVDLKGAGTERSDSIVARLSKGESVITAKGTRQDKGLFEAANKLELEKYINANYILPALKEKQKSEGAMFDDYRLYLTMIKGQNQDKELNKKLVKVLGQRVNKNNNWA